MDTKEDVRAELIATEEEERKQAEEEKRKAIRIQTITKKTEQGDSLFAKNRPVFYGLFGFFALAILCGIYAAIFYERPIPKQIQDALADMYRLNFQLDGEMRMCKQSCGLIPAESTLIKDLKDREQYFLKMQLEGGDYEGQYYVGMKVLRDTGKRNPERTLSRKGELYDDSKLQNLVDHALAARGAWMDLEKKAETCREGKAMPLCLDFDDRLTAVACSRLVATSLPSGECHFSPDEDTFSVVESFINRTEKPFEFCWNYWGKRFPDSNVNGVREIGTYIDKKCPWTGNVSIRGRILTGIVVKLKMQRTIVIRRDYLHYVRKYHRFEKRHKNMSVHLSPAFRDVKAGDVVTVGECRPLAKTVRFNVLKVTKQSGAKKGFDKF